MKGVIHILVENRQDGKENQCCERRKCAIKENVGKPDIRTEGK